VSGDGSPGRPRETLAGPASFETDSWAFPPDERHPLVTALLSADGIDYPAVFPGIHADDEMFRELLRLRHGARDPALVDYFRTGRLASRALEQILRLWKECTPTPGRPFRVLDFACGWGRVTRFLAPQLAGAELWVSDVSAPAVEHLRRHLGVRGFPSALRPEDLLVPDQTRPGFDVLCVASLFSHLPRAQWGAWLRRLWALVAPRGLLVFSVHGEPALPPGVELPAEGWLFVEWSEIGWLPQDAYGSTFVSEPFVREALLGAAPEAGPVARLPRSLWHLQDLYLVPRGVDADWSALAFDPGIEGHVLAVRQRAEGALEVAGWAVDRGEPGSPLRIRASLDGVTVLETIADQASPEVAARHGEALSHVGWCLRIDSAPPTAAFLVEAVAASGGTEVLHLSSVEAAVAAGRAQRLDQEVSRLEDELERARQELRTADGHLTANAGQLRALEARLAEVEASRFWKLRNLWHAMKRGPGR
jgi:SAM-dependent methyltransferase